MKTILLLLPFVFLFTLFTSSKVDAISENDRVADVLVQLGDTPVNHQVNTSVKGANAKAGKELITKGFTKDGIKTARQSAHFVCTSCHNIERDEPDLQFTDAQARLDYVKEKGLPFLQGSALYGAVNRTSFYNGDYQKKYGDLVAPARNDLREAIQLCAVECAQGRPLADWEMESVLAYLWEIGLTIKDLGLTTKEMAQINNALQNKSDRSNVIQLIKSKYAQGAPATFIAPPENRKKGFEAIKGNPENGQLVYDLSCQHCHEGQRYSYFNLDDASTTFKYLEKHFSKYTRYSTYQVARYGTSPVPGKRAYMPQYTQQKMDNQLLEDLRAYIQMKSKGK